MSIHDLTPLLQGAIGPVILISGVGLLLLSMTNRIGRVLDRSRQAADELRSAAQPARAGIRAQLDILYRRARLLRAAITFATLSVLMAALLVICLFLVALYNPEMGGVGAALFVLCMLSLICSLIYFLLDVNSSLEALKLTIDSVNSETK